MKTVHGAIAQPSKKVCFQKGMFSSLVFALPSMLVTQWRQSTCQPSHCTIRYRLGPDSYFEALHRLKWYQEWEMLVAGICGKFVELVLWNPLPINNNILVIWKLVITHAHGVGTQVRNEVRVCNHKTLLSPRKVVVRIPNKNIGMLIPFIHFNTTASPAIKCTILDNTFE